MFVRDRSVASNDCRATVLFHHSSLGEEQLLELLQGVFWACDGVTDSSLVGEDLVVVSTLIRLRNISPRAY